MSTIQSIKMIYRYGQDANSDIPELSGRYELILIMGPEGWIPRDKVAEIFRTQFGKPCPDSIIFTAMEDMKAFGLSVTKEYGAYELLMISTTDYNIGIKSIHHKKEFNDLYRHFGMVVKNEQALKGFALKKLNPFSKG